MAACNTELPDGSKCKKPSLFGSRKCLIHGGVQDELFEGGYDAHMGDK